MRRIIGTTAATLAVAAAIAACATPASAVGHGHAGGVNVALGDGSVRFISSSTLSIQTWQALGTRAGGEVLPTDY
jgi:prepilin-type processing-associated H-X9-DG protein